MNPQITRRLLLALLVVAWGVVDAVVLALHISPWRPQPSDVTECLILILLTGQCAMMAGWLALGDGSWVHRLTAAVSVVLAWHAGVRMLDRSFPISDFLIVSAIHFTAIFVPLFVVRMRGVQLHHPWSQGISASRWQFSLLQIIALTAIVAFVLGYLRQVPWTSRIVPLWHLIVLGLLATFAGWLSWSAVFRFGALASAISVIALLVVLGVAATLLTPQFPGFSAALMSGVVAVMTTSQSVLRIAGYQLGTPPVAKSPKPELS